ncbi:unnamed protein product [Acanthosepion pharaonis]|uniref:Transmembrane protein n=1 Tax=Acanthosepion pharaonis TaxID=158019 RepID=A0A812CUA3_ACAPH|nr:unnamed protein product [Sepia pharaonis]
MNDGLVIRLQRSRIVVSLSQQYGFLSMAVFFFPIPSLINLSLSFPLTFLSPSVISSLFFFTSYPLSPKSISLSLSLVCPPLKYRQCVFLLPPPSLLNVSLFFSHLYVPLRNIVIVFFSSPLEKNVSNFLSLFPASVISSLFFFLLPPPLSPKSISLFLSLLCSPP